MIAEIRGGAVDAQRRIRTYVRRTPLEPSADLAGESGGPVFLKLENLQHTGSFKVRGAINRIMALTPEQREAGVVTASSGNHALAVVFGLNRLGVDGVIYLPESASPQKVRMLENQGATICFHGSDCEETEAHARRQADISGKVYISPYNDPQVVAGQGTIALEILDRLPRVDCIMASVGGGGLISGIAGLAKSFRNKIRIVGCLPIHSPTMAASVEAGRIVGADIRPTLSDGTAGGIEAGAITFDACRSLVDDWILVTEAEIRSAMRRIFESHRLVIEGAAGVAVAGFLKMARRLHGQTVVVVLCGGNVDVGLFKTIVCASG